MDYDPQAFPCPVDVCISVYADMISLLPGLTECFNGGIITYDYIKVHKISRGRDA